MRSFAGRDILSLKDFERNEFFHVFEIADELEPIARERRNTDLLADKTMVTAFYQPSTRTRLAHEAAMHRLGGHVTGFSDAKMTRAGDLYQKPSKTPCTCWSTTGMSWSCVTSSKVLPTKPPVGHRSRSSTPATVGVAPHPGSHRPLHRTEGDRQRRREDLCLHRRSPHAHHALHRLCPSASSTPKW